MVTRHTTTLGTLLRRHRLEVGLTQEALAERAGVSPRVISEIERGGRHLPRRDTVALLAEALGLSDHDHATFEAAARRTGDAAEIPSSPPSAPSPRRVALPVPLTPLLGREHDEAGIVH